MAEKESPHYVDVEMTPELAMELIERKLPGIDRVVETTDIKIGFNNRCYGIRTENGDEYILRLTKDSWPETKIIAEAAALAALKYYAINLPVPKLIAYDEKSHPSLGVRWMLMQKMPGICLENVWETASSDQRKYIAEQLKNILTTMQTREFEKIGGWTFERETPILGPFFEDGSGPFDNEKEWILSQFHTKVDKAQTKEILAPLRSLIEPATTILMNYLETLVPAKTVLFHGDFAFRNILVDETCTISGILDWEWCGTMPKWIEWVNCSFNDHNVPSYITSLHYEDQEEYAARYQVYELCQAFSPWQLEAWPEKQQQYINNSITTIQKAIDFLQALA